MRSVGQIGKREPDSSDCLDINAFVLYKCIIVVWELRRGVGRIEVCVVVLRAAIRLP